jgi:hypothetical protein
VPDGLVVDGTSSVTWWFRARDRTGLFSKASEPHGKVELASGASHAAAASHPASAPASTGPPLEDDVAEPEELEDVDVVDVEAACGELHAATADKRRRERVLDMRGRRTSLMPRESYDETGWSVAAAKHLTVRRARACGVSDA